jgi:hypothetical protein
MAREAFTNPGYLVAYPIRVAGDPAGRRAARELTVRTAVPRVTYAHAGIAATSRSLLHTPLHARFDLA